MKDQCDDEFYVGYLPRAPFLIGRRARGVALALVACGVALAAVLVLGQERLAGGTFEFLRYRTFVGVIREQPYPTLEVPRPGVDGD
jgi:hypothetical protein